MAGSSLSSSPQDLHSLRGSRLLLSAALGGALVLLPLLLFFCETRLLGSTYGKPYQPFELFGFFVTVALCARAFSRLRHLGGRLFAETADDWVPVAAFTLTALYGLTLLFDRPLRSWDYACYEQAAAALLSGHNPYAGTGYLYPPLLAQAFAAAYRGIQAGLALFHLQARMDDAQILGCIFYLYQCLQFFLLVAAYRMLGELARRMGLGPWQAAVLIGSLLVFDNPLFRTLKHGQINLYVLDAILLVMLYHQKRPILCGAAVAVAAHLKIYPLLLVVPLIFCGSWPAAAAAVLGTGALLVLEQRLGHGALAQFGQSLLQFPKGTLLRDNSLHSLLHNLAGLVRADRLLGAQGAGRLVDGLALLAGLALSGWVFFRWFPRLRLSLRPKSPAAAQKRHGPLQQYGRFCATIVIMMLLSPLVWEHHYVLTLPIAVWAIAGLPGTQAVWAAAAAFLMYAPPTFDVFPFSYHRLCGLLWLVWLTARRRSTMAGAAR